MAKKFGIENNNGVLKRQIDVDDTTGRLVIYDETDAAVIDVESHQARHVSGGADALSGVTYDQLATDTIVIEVPFPVPDSPQTGLAADSTGVKWTSSFKGKWNTRHLKAVRIRGSWTASNADSTTKIAVKDVTSGSEIASVSGNTGTDSETEVTNPANITDGGLFEIFAEVTVASGTAGATFDIVYVVVEIKYGIA